MDVWDDYMHLQKKFLGKSEDIYPAILIFYLKFFGNFWKIDQNHSKNEIKKLIAPTPIQNSTNGLVWIYKMTICTFRKIFEKIGGYIPGRFRGQNLL